jgi:hypothetical protein
MRLREQPELTLATVVNGWQRHSITPNPEYQRGRSWKPGQQKLLVDSTLRGYPLGGWHERGYDGKARRMTATASTRQS